MALDIRLFYFFNNLAGKSGVFDGLFVFFASYFQYFIVAAFILILVFFQYERRKKIQIFWATLISAAIARFGAVELIRFFYHRPRPFMALEAVQLVSDNAWSFPSGHAAFFFAMAAAIYFYNKKWGAGFFFAAFLISISRVIAGIHYPSDIIGGALIGIIIASIVLFCYKRYKPSSLKIT